jgi:flotillin
MAEGTAGLVMTFIIVIAILSMIIVFAMRYVRVPPSKAMVVFTGGTLRHVISGGGKFLAPFVETYELLPLDVRVVDIELDNVRADPGTDPKKVRVQVSALVKITSEPSALKSAAESLIGKHVDEIDHIGAKAIEEAIRSRLNEVALDEVNRDWEAFAAVIASLASEQLWAKGLEIRSLTVRDVRPKGMGV